jgi:hypothetical protein
MLSVPESSGTLGWPGGEGGFLGLGWLRAAGMPGPVPIPAEAEADPLWNDVVSRQDAHREKLDPPFDTGDPPYRLFLNAGASLVKPHLESNPAFTLFQTHKVGSTTQLLRSSVQGLSYESEFMPHVSLGVEYDSGWGIRSTWWRFAEGSNQANLLNLDATGSTIIQPPPVFGVPGFSSPGVLARQFQVFQETLSFGTHLETQVCDSEVTRCFTLGSWELLLAGGGRYTYLSQGYSAFRFNKGTGKSGTSKVTITQDSDLVTTGHNFSGFGPTLAIEVHRPLWNTGFAFYGTGRSSVTFGRGRTRSQQITIQSFQIIPTKGSTQTVKTTVERDASSGHNDVLPVEEMEIGIEWSRRCGRVGVLLQTGVVVQDWTNTGNGSSEKGDLSVIGLSLTAGCSY